MIFTCPRCRRTKDFGATYIPPLGRSFICPCGLNTLVRPTWAADGSKQLVAAGPKEPSPATAEQQKTITVKVDAVKERLLPREGRAPAAGAVPAVTEENEVTALEDVTEQAPARPVVPTASESSPASRPSAPPSGRVPMPPPSPPPRPQPLPPRTAAPSPTDTTTSSPARSAPPPPMGAPPRPLPGPALRTLNPPPVTTAGEASAPTRGSGPAPRTALPPPPAASRPAAPRPPPPPPPLPPPATLWTGPVTVTKVAAEPSVAPRPTTVVPVRPPDLPPRAVPVPRRAVLGMVEAGLDTVPIRPIAPPDDEETPPDDDGLERTAVGVGAISAIPVTAPPPTRPAPPPPPPPDETARWVAQETTAGRMVIETQESTWVGPMPARAPEEEDAEEIPAAERGEEPAGLADVLEPPTEGSPAAQKPKRRWWVRLLIAATWTVLGVLLFAGGIGYFEYRQMVKDLPPIDSIKHYRPPVVTEIRDRNGSLVGKYADEERYVLPLDAIPLHVRRAFLAAEDADFYKHSGVDFKAIIRAALKNAESGKSSQGASTITQQVARAFFLTREKTYKRKIQELLLSKKIESELSKDEILHRYLNQIFFGHGAYGVEAAARIHFGKHAADLTIAEAALLAGLPQRPSSYSPNEHPDEALHRRAYVLSQMLANGWITPTEKADADAEPLKLSSMPDPTLIAAPYTVEQIRKDLVDKFGHDAVYRGGLQVTATLDQKLEAAAQKSVRAGLVVLDHRIGWRGASRHVEADKIEATVAALGKDAPKPGERTRAVVTEVNPEQAWLRMAGGAKGVLHLSDNLWAYPPNPESYWKYRVQTDLGKALKAGDLIDVQVIDPKDSAYAGDQARFAKRKGWKPDPKLAAKLEGRLPVQLLQSPDVQGSLLSFHIPDGRVLAMVGGTDFEKSQFIRPIQSKRQVGSTFKTIVYAAALSKLPPDIAEPLLHKKRVKSASAALLGMADPGAPQVWTLASILQDAPVVMTAKEAELTHRAGADKAADEQQDWKPGNYGNKYYGDTPLRTAFILSRNLPTLQLAQKVGIRNIMEMARKLGIESDLPPDLSIALGSASLTLLELSRAHAVFANGGVAVQTHFVEKVVDRDGKVKFDLNSELAKSDPLRIIDPRPAFVMAQLLGDVAKFGTAAKATELKRPSGGKTGTTNDYIDAWFIGFTPSIVTGVWVGYDQVKSMGVGETGGEAALPIWVDYMKVATADLPKEDFTPPEGVVKLKIDRKSGKLAWAGESGEDMVETWFVKGTEPTETARQGKINDQPNIFQADPGLR